MRCRWKDVQQIQVLTSPEAFDDLTTDAGAKRGCASAPKAANKGQPPCSAVTGYEGTAFDISDVQHGHATMVTLKRALPAVREAAYTFGLDHICAQAALPEQQVRHSSVRDVHSGCAHSMWVSRSTCEHCERNLAKSGCATSDLLCTAQHVPFGLLST